jgi:hypothetical protein
MNSSKQMSPHFVKCLSYKIVPARILRRNKIYCILILCLVPVDNGGPWWRSWLRQSATNRKVAGSISDGVNGIFHWQNPVGRTMALGIDSASNRNEYQEYFLGDKGGRCVGLTTLPPSCADCLEIWEPRPPRTLTL